MSTQHWQKVEEIFQEALDLPADSREVFLTQACGGDSEVQREAISLLNAYASAGDFIDEPAIVMDARVLASALPDRNIGRVIGAYEIVDRIGSGGMGDVYLANDSRLGRQVALKILAASLADPNQLRRFETEARAASQLNHPNVLTVHEVGSLEGISFIATEFIDGDTLRQSIAMQDLSFADALDITIQITSALVAAHTAGIVHRDIKPENIMRRRDGLVKVLDFGIAKPSAPLFTNTSLDGTTAQTELGVLLGTVAYMSPEQARGLLVDERTDLWSVGVVLYELLSGTQPFTGPTRMDTLAAILERKPKPLLSDDPESSVQNKLLQRILERTLCKDREQRYQSAEELLADLKQTKQSIDWSTVKPGLNLETSGGAKGSSRIWQWAVPLLLLVGVTLVLAVRYRAGRSSPVVPAGIGVETRSYSSLSEAEKLVFVRNQEQRISAMMGDRPAALNEEALQAIKRRIDEYDSRRLSTSNQPGGESLEEIYSRALPHIPLIARSFSAERVPVTIGIYLPMIESEYRPCFENHIGAKGMFQFMPQTARTYGVAQHEMCDDTKMTPAAARYIADRMAELGEDAQSMTLVLLSYNRGQEWVRDTLRDLRGTENFKRDFWTLFAHRNELDETFRNENADYVPRFFAAAIIGENPQAFGLQVPPLSTLASQH
jgi:serine/threonine protein kinase